MVNDDDKVKLWTPMLDDKPETNPPIVKMNYIVKKPKSSSEGVVKKPNFASGSLLLSALKKKMVEQSPILKSLAGLRSKKIKKDCFTLKKP